MKYLKLTLSLIQLYILNRVISFWVLKDWHLWSISSTIYVRVFLYESAFILFPNQNIAREKLREALSYKKGVCKMLMKLIPCGQALKDCSTIAFFSFLNYHVATEGFLSCFKACYSIWSFLNNEFKFKVVTFSNFPILVITITYQSNRWAN